MSPPLRRGHNNVNNLYMFKQCGLTGRSLVSDISCSLPTTDAEIPLLSRASAPSASRGDLGLEDTGDLGGLRPLLRTWGSRSDILLQRSHLQRMHSVRNTFYNQAIHILAYNTIRLLLSVELGEIIHRQNIESMETGATF